MARIRSIKLHEIPKSSGAGRYIYVIGECGLLSPVKIGVASHPIWRLQGLRAGNHRPMELRRAWIIDDKQFAGTVERKIHKNFRSALVHGEWFMVTADDVAVFISELAASR